MPDTEKQVSLLGAQKPDLETGKGTGSLPNKTDMEMKK